MLLVHSPQPQSRYSRYLGELLRLEGFADFEEADLADLRLELLARHDLIVLPRLALTGAQVDLLAEYVERGGRLIAMLPDARLAARLGLTATHRGVDSGWLHPDAGAGSHLGAMAIRRPILQGLCVEPIQIIGPVVEHQAAAGSGTLAQVYATAAAEGDALAGVLHTRVGAGEAIVFGYDLPDCVARLRQGNPDHADLCFAGLDGIFRPSELFVGQTDAGQMHLPQADLHSALLARLVETLAPRPRLWYYPEAQQRSAVIMTSDDDWSTLEQFETLIAGLRTHNAHCTFYVVPETRLSRADMDRWEKEGHTFSVHPAHAGDIRRGVSFDLPQRLAVPDMLRDNIARHQRDFGRRVRTVRCHAVRWLGYVEEARLLAELGVEMDTNYISVYPFSLGYMCGSGHPLPFVDTDGTLIACYQQPSLWTEEVLIHPSFVFSFKWTVERALQETGAIIRRAAQDFYAPITFNSHPVSFATYSSPLIEGCWNAALDEGMPILSAEEWLDWVQARRGAQCTVDAGGFTLTTSSPLAALTVLTPWPAFSEHAEVSHTVHLWGQDRHAITLRALAAGDAPGTLGGWQWLVEMSIAAMLL